jgi:hypothetical protein
MGEGSWWGKIPDTWKIVIAIVGGITLIIGTYRTVESYYTKRCDFDAHAKKNSQDIAEVSEQSRKSAVRQDLRWNSKEQYDLEKHLRSYPNDEIAQERLHKLKDEQRQMEVELAPPVPPSAPKNPRMLIYQ